MLYNNKNLKVGDKVYGKYESTEYYGIVISISKNGCKVDMYYDKAFKVSGCRGWDCRKRPDGNYACAAGCDDGLHNLKIINKKNIELEFYGKYL